MIRRIRMLGCGLVAVLAGCASQPMSFLVGSPLSDTNVDLVPVRVVGLDGEMVFGSAGPWVSLAPGTHVVRLSVPPGRQKYGSPLAPTPDVPGDHSRNRFFSVRQMPDRTVLMKIEPCTRYYLGAGSPTTPNVPWDLVIETKERVEGCNVEDELKKAAPHVAAAPAKAN